MMEHEDNKFDHHCLFTYVYITVLYNFKYAK